jgi:hypothetical protein
VKAKHDKRAALLLAAALLTAAAPAGADWLVTTQGGKVETKGAWKVKGKLVVFTLPDGKLSSLRLNEVDLDASRRVTEEAVAAAAAALAAPPPERPKPKEAKVILTDKDFQKAAPPPAPAAEETKEGEAAPKPAGEVVVTSWERAQDPGGHVVLTGAVRNDAPNDATGVAVTVLLYDETGKLLVSGNAVLSSTVLPAGQSGSFRAEFQDVYTFAAAKFEARGMHILRKPDSE